MYHLSSKSGIDPWGFYIFAVVAAIGAACIALVNRDPEPGEPQPLTEEETEQIGHRSATPTNSVAELVQPSISAR